jgi:hypothetical protein
MYYVGPRYQAEEEELQPRVGAGVNKVFVRRTSVAKPQGIGVGCNTTSPVKGVDTMLVTGGVTINQKAGGGRGLGECVAVTNLGVIWQTYDGLFVF